MWAGRIIYHIKFWQVQLKRGAVAGEFQTGAQEPAHKLIIKETLTHLSALAVVGSAEQRQQQESQSDRGQQVPVPSFYKLQLIGHLVFSTERNNQPASGLLPGPWTRSLQSHSTYHMWTTVTGQTHCDLKNHFPPLASTGSQLHLTELCFLHFQSCWIFISPIKNYLATCRMEIKYHTIHSLCPFVKLNKPVILRQQRSLILL